MVPLTKLGPDPTDTVKKANNHTLCRVKSIHPQTRQLIVTFHCYRIKLTDFWVHSPHGHCQEGSVLTYHIILTYPISHSLPIISPSLPTLCYSPYLSCHSNTPSALNTPPYQHEAQRGVGFGVKGLGCRDESLWLRVYQVRAQKQNPVI